MDQVKEIIKRSGFRLIRLESGEEIRVPNALFSLTPLYRGECFDPNAYRLSLRVNEDSSALQQAVFLLQQRDYATEALKQKLLNKAYSESAIQKALDTLISRGFLNDERYALSLAQKALSRYGNRRAGFELRRKGISSELTKQTLESFDENLETESASKLLVKQLKRFKGNPLERKNHAYAYLARRGFKPESIQKVLAQVDFSDDDLTEDESNFE